MTPAAIIVKELDPNSPHLATVKALGKVNASTLGFLPDGAFDEYVLRGQIIAAFKPSGDCCGYALFRISRRRVHLAHLCVNNADRNDGIGRALIEHLKSLTKPEYLGISLKCRRDYSANTMWPKFGFTVTGEVLGRGKDRMPLTCWELDYGHPTLFTAPIVERLSSKLCVVLDANVFFDLDDENRPGHVESGSLLADWLPENLELCLTDEIRNEINRGTDPIQRRTSWAAAEQFVIPPCDDSEFTLAQRQLKQHFPTPMTARDESDLRQLARTVASYIQFFVTRDERLLNLGDDLYKAVGVSIIRPSDLILRFDELRREADYQPARLAGTLSQSRLIQSTDEKLVLETFLARSVGETKEMFGRQLRKLFSDPIKYECRVVESADRSPVALFVFDRTDSDTLELPLFRVRRGPLSKTIARYLAFYANWQSAAEQRVFTRITDTQLDADMREMIASDNFSHSEAGWVKVNIGTVGHSVEIAKQLRALKYRNEDERRRFFDIADLLESGVAIPDAATISDLEYLLWPAKILDGAIQTYLVPIQPEWAKDLFDEGLANQTLFGADVELALNRESVYYRSKRPTAGLKAPARILWYISKKSRRYAGVGQVRACSRLEEVVVGKPKDLFRQFRRIGVFRWENVFALADYDLDKEIMAIRFSDTELFAAPIEERKMQEVLATYGQRAMLMSAVRISAKAFGELYELGMRRRSE
jgi:hypothetical protein